MDYLFVQIWICLAVAFILGAFLCWIWMDRRAGAFLQSKEHAWREKLHTAERQVEASKRNLKDAAATTNRLEQMVSNLTNKLEASETDWEAKFDDLGTQLTERSARVAALEANLQQSSAWKAKYDAVVLELENAKRLSTETETRLVESNANSEASERQRAELEQQWQESLAAKELRIRSLTQMSEERKDALAECQERSHQLSLEWQSKNKKLSERIETLAANSRQDETNELSEMRARLTGLEANLATAKAQLSEHETMAENLRAQAVSAGDIGALRARLAALQSQLDRSRSKNTAQTTLLASLQARLTSAAEPPSSQTESTKTSGSSSPRAKGAKPSAAPKRPRAGRYAIFRSEKNNQYYFRFTTTANKLIIRSEGYTSKASCEKGIRSVLQNAHKPDRIREKTSRNGKHFFDLVARNGEIVATSGLFDTHAAMIRCLAMFGPQTDWTKVDETVRSGRGAKIADRKVAKKPRGAKKGPAQPRRRDDLKRIHGIGPVLERLLNKHRITSYRQIASWSAKDIEKFTKLLDTFVGRIRRDRWIQEAKREHFNKYGERL